MAGGYGVQASTLVAGRRAADVMPAATPEIGRVHLTAPRELVNVAEHVVKDRIDGADHETDHFVHRSVHGTDRVDRESSALPDGLVDPADDIQIRTGCECGRDSGGGDSECRQHDHRQATGRSSHEAPPPSVEVPDGLSSSSTGELESLTRTASHIPC